MTIQTAGNIKQKGHTTYTKAAEQISLNVRYREVDKQKVSERGFVTTLLPPPFF